MGKYTIGKKIAFLRKTNGYTQGKLADLIGVSAQTISKWESEVTMPDIMLLPVIANIFDISIDELFSESKSKEIETYSFDQCVEKTYDAILLSIIKSFAHENDNIKNLEDEMQKRKKIFNENKNMKTMIRSYSTKGAVFANSRFAFVYNNAFDDSLYLLNDSNVVGFLTLLGNITVRKIILYCYDKHDKSFTLKSLSLKTSCEENEISKVIDDMCKFKLLYSETIENDNEQVTIYKPYAEYKLYLLFTALSIIENLANYQECFYGFRG